MLRAAGASSAERFRREAAAVRDLFAEGRLGVPDLVLFADVPIGELRGRRDSDTTRRRNNFALHARLADPLREWYGAFATLDADDRVRWELPVDGMPSAPPPPRANRTDPALLDQLLAALPAF